MNSHLRLQPNQRRSCARFLRFTLVWLIPLGCFAQQAPAPQQDPVPQQVSMPQDSCAFSAPGRCAIEIARDQTGILTSPFRMHKNDLLWLAPLAAELVLAQCERPAADVITYIPPDRVRQLERACHPAQSLAHELAARWGLACEPLLERTRVTKRQATLPSQPPGTATCKAPRWRRPT